MTVFDIVVAHLNRNGYDGLFNSDNHCGCVLRDLVPGCEEFSIAECQAGYKAMCMPDCAHEFPYEEGQWHIQAEKPEVKNETSHTQP